MVRVLPGTDPVNPYAHSFVPPAHTLPPMPSETIPSGTQESNFVPAGNFTAGLIPMSNIENSSLPGPAASYWALIASIPAPPFIEVTLPFLNSIVTPVISLPSKKTRSNTIRPVVVPGTGVEKTSPAGSHTWHAAPPPPVAKSAFEIDPSETKHGRRSTPKDRSVPLPCRVACARFRFSRNPFQAAGDGFPLAWSSFQFMGNAFHTNGD